MDVLRNVAVETCEELHQDKEKVDRESVGHDLRKLLDRFLSRIELGVPPHDQTENDQKTGTRRES